MPLNFKHAVILALADAGGLAPETMASPGAAWQLAVKR